MLNLLKQSSSLCSFQEAVTKKGSLLVENLWDAPKAALLSLIRDAAKQHVIVITAKTQGGALLDNLPYFGAQQIEEFPPWEILPGEEIDPSLDIVGKRLQLLYKLLDTQEQMVIQLPLQAALQKMVDPKLLKELSLTWNKGDEISFDRLDTTLEKRGYKKVALVSDKGEYAIRGGILDIFPIASPAPLRLEFFDDEIEEIRSFDPIGQKSTGKLESLFIPPTSERALLDKDSPSFLDYLSPRSPIIFDDLLELEDRYLELKKMPGANSSLFLSWEAFFEQTTQHPQIFWTKERAEELSDIHITKKEGRAFYTGKNPFQSLSFEMLGREISTTRWNHPFSDLTDLLSATDNRAAASPQEMLHTLGRFAQSHLNLYFVTSTESEEKVLKQQLENIPLPQNTHFQRGYLSQGMALTETQTLFFPFSQLSQRLPRTRQKWRTSYHTPPSDFHQLSIGDLVVHFNHGIGKYLGIEKRTNHLGVETEFILLEFAESSKLYVPLAQTHLVSRYIGAKEEIPTLHTLGTKKWQHTKIKAVQAIMGYAQELLNKAAEREIEGGFAYPPDSEEMQAFESDFPFVETEDQLRAIREIKEEMCSPKPMDRLICGDVGYGKTEVAMRAAFKAVVDGKKQVALLVPTTVLALQHFESFTERMRNFPVNIGLVSRFHSVKENRETLKKAQCGQLDILIGTHRMISKDVSFANLGLVIIDEEQRFGVRAKEYLKALKKGAECLTLSATPIPRTLYLSIIGAKEISLINTPPQDRLPIKTILSEKDPSIIQNALLRELSRDGQAIYIHNRVETIFKVKEELQNLLPQAKIIVGHGQMSPTELDTLFHAFKEGSVDILVATTIVENGIDIPNVNTILIDRADMFGLADLYQMRGRVGRGNRPAYAYFLTPKGRELPELTRKRLDALKEGSGFGGGMKIAMRDLEIRGAGDILGTEQSGQVATIGFHLYCKLLKRTVEAMRQKRAPTFFETKMEFSFDARIPEEYITDSSLRIEIYHRLGETSSKKEVEELIEELRDRFGKPPLPVLWLEQLRYISLFASLHTFTLLKFDKLTYLAEFTKGKQTHKKILTLPPTQNPKPFAQAVIEQLQNLLKTY